MNFNDFLKLFLRRGDHGITKIYFYYSRSTKIMTGYFVYVILRQTRTAKTENRKPKIKHRSGILIISNVYYLTKANV